MADVSAIALSVLNDFCFNNVWNAMESEVRANYTLTPLSQRYMSGGVTYGNVKISQLPPGSFMVYGLSARSLRDRPKFTTDWWTPIDLAQNNRVLMSVYNNLGLVMPYDSVYISRVPDRNMILIAVGRDAFEDLGVSTQDTLYMTMYTDEKSDTDLYIKSFTIGSSGVSLSTDITQTLAVIKSELVSHPTAMVYQNGYEVDVSSLTLASGDRVNVVVDDDVFACYDANIDEAVTGYLSTKYNGYREVLHTPKSLNPDGWVVTHDSVTVHIRDTQTNKGVFYLRISDDAIEQITHNDVSISRDIVGFLRDSMAVANVKARVRVRKKPALRFLVEDKSLISDLYSCDDATIVQFLSGKGDASLPFWQAVSLEASPFVELIFGSTKALLTNTISSYLQALGYYEVCAILSKSHVSTTYDTTPILIRKTEVLVGTKVTPLLYAGDIKIRQDQLNVVDYDAKRVWCDPLQPVGFTVGDPMDVYLLEGTSFTPQRVSVAVLSQILTLTSSDVDVFQEITLDTPLTGRFGSYDKGYVRVAPNTSSTYLEMTQSDGTPYIVFGATLVGSTVVVIPRVFTMSSVFDVTQTVVDGDAILVSPTWVCQDDTPIPPLNYNITEIYLNGRRLIQDVDYMLKPKPISNDMSRIAFLDIAITNREFLDLSGTGTNTVEVIFSTMQNMSSDSGYCVNGIMARSAEPSIWDAKISRLFIGGSLTYAIKDQSVYFTGDFLNGRPFVLSTYVYTCVTDLLSSYDRTVDSTRKALVDTYFNRVPPSEPAIVEYTQLYELYSPYLAKIAYDISKGTVTVANDPSESTFMGQFDAYADIRSIDPMINIGTSKVSTRFCALAASYTNLTVSDPTAYKVLQRLIGYVLPAQYGKTIGETLV